MDKTDGRCGSRRTGKSVAKKRDGKGGKGRKIKRNGRGGLESASLMKSHTNYRAYT